MPEQHATPLKFLIPGWFSVVMGLCGLALAWARAAPVMGDFALAGSAIVGALAALVLLLVSGLSLLKMQRYLTQAHIPYQMLGWYVLRQVTNLAKRNTS
jgi:tellurite resistance protein TehA-like permease